MTDSQQVNQAINVQLEDNNSDHSDTVMSEQMNEMSIINIDKKNNKSSSNKKLIGLYKHFNDATTKY